MPKESKNRRMDRPTLFDSIKVLDDNNNIFCNIKDLTNESTVEQRFALRLLSDLGYTDVDIKSKDSITPVIISLGRKKIPYRPDFQIIFRKRVGWILDAKATNEPLENWVGQCASYCFEINKDRDDLDRAKYFMLTNGLYTKVYPWDSNLPILELKFSDFHYGNPRYGELHKLLSKHSFDHERYTRVTRKFEFKRPSMSRVRQLFTECHAKIWKMDKRSPASAFSEFVKIMFVKLYEDKKLRHNPEIAELIEKGLPLPPDVITFSFKWIEALEKEMDNPVDAILFTRLRNALEKEILTNKKKRVFEPNEHIELRPSTIKEVVRRMQHHDLFGIDEDLNGRLFESFLTATMRGRELGQFFTPRSIVMLMTELADLRVDREHIDTVMDACCGTGGFLIEALTDMRNKVRNNASLTSEEKIKLIEKISNESLYGIDAGVEPPIARIARINMYLHGDGGSRIYFADSLDKFLSPEKGEDIENAKNRKELSTQLRSIKFDVVLTNPPFAMRYEKANDNEKRILEQYELAKRGGDANKLRPSLKSSVMFIERYRDILKPGGKLLTVIDDTVLAGKEFPFVRDFIRKYFIIRAVISLPGDAFQRSGARAKTSVLFLEKKRNENEKQPDKVFMAFSTCLGIDDPTSQRITEAEINAKRKAADEEISFLTKSYKEFLAGRTEPWSEHGPWAVDSNRLSDRIDVKFCVPIQGRFVARWKKQGLNVVKLYTLVKLVENRKVIPSQEPNKIFKIFAIQYNGRCRIDNEVKGSDLKYHEFTRVEKGDLVFSTINAVQGAIGIVDEKTAGALASTNYTVLRCIDPNDTAYLWSLLRSSELRADLLSICTGFGRHYLYWPDFGQVDIPLLPPETRKIISDKLTVSLKAELEAEKLRCEALTPIIEQLGVESEESQTRLSACKPPR